MRLIREAAGVYVTADGRYRIVNSEQTGPRGGVRPLWEIAEPDRWSSWVVGRYPPAYTLREARETLETLYR